MTKTIDPLNDSISSMELIDSMGTDLSVADAARVSMDKTSEWDISEDGEKVLSERDRKLINYLAKHNHWTPFAQATIKLRIKMPIFVARQWYKHTVGFVRNEVSRRYVSTTPEFYIPQELRASAENVKQGSSDELIKNNYDCVETIANQCRQAKELYDDLINKEGLCPEQARIILPQSMYTEFIETGSLYAYSHLANLRNDAHAQKEVREYSQGVSKILSEIFPVSWDSLVEDNK